MTATHSPSHLHFVNPPDLPTPPGYSQVVAARPGQTIYVAGQVSLDRDGRVVGEGDFRAQCRQTFANVGRALEAAGADFSHVVKLTTFVTDMSALAEFRAARDEVLGPAIGAPPPASTLVQVQQLFRPEFLIEIEAVAVVPI
jgi:enamine deaminase RidA (YjgF/YER057c/UK114 family)